MHPSTLHAMHSLPACIPPSAHPGVCEESLEGLLLPKTHSSGQAGLQKAQSLFCSRPLVKNCGEKAMGWEISARSGFWRRELD